MLSLTFDTDWVPDVVLADTMELLAQAGQRATFFCTSSYSSSLLKDHEAALHPNYFNNDLSELEHLRKLKAMYPDAIGVRAHGLFFHGRLLTEIYPSIGLRYSSDYILPFQPDLRPVEMLGLWQMPIFFADITWLRYKANPALPQPFKMDKWQLDDQYLKVFCFHPIHIFLNTPHLNFYEKAKTAYQNPTELSQLRNHHEFGIRDLFKALLATLKMINISSSPLKDILIN